MLARPRARYCIRNRGSSTLSRPISGRRRRLLLAGFDVEPYRQLALATAGIGSLENAVAAAAMAARGKGRDYTAVGDAFAARWRGGAPTVVDKQGLL